MSVRLEPTHRERPPHLKRENDQRMLPHLLKGGGGGDVLAKAVRGGGGLPKLEGVLFNLNSQSINISRIRHPLKIQTPRSKRDVLPLLYTHKSRNSFGVDANFPKNAKERVRSLWWAQKTDNGGRPRCLFGLNPHTKIGPRM